MLGIQPAFSEADAIVLRVVEEKRGAPLPPSLQEWFSLEQCLEIGEQYSVGGRFADHMDLLPTANPYWRWNNETGEEEPEPDYRMVRILDLGQGDFDAWVFLDGRDDPSVVVDASEWIDKSHLREKWVLSNDTFSAFVFDWFAQQFLDAEERGCCLSAIDDVPSEYTLSFLRETFDEGPSSEGVFRQLDLPGLTTVPHLDGDATDFNYRFFSPDGVIWIRGGQMRDSTENKTWWHLLARSEVALHDLAKPIRQIGSLANTLRPSEEGTETWRRVNQTVCHRVLDRLRAQKERPR